MESLTLRPIVASVLGVVADKFIMQEDDIQRSLHFGALCGVGIYASEYIAPMIPHLPTLSKDLYNGKELAVRIAEVSSMAGTVYIVNKYVTKNDIYKGEMYQRLAVIAGVDILSAYIVDYIENKPLSYLI